jgi:hypothetical protein
MGISMGSKCSSSPYAAPNSNPDPLNFKVVNHSIVRCKANVCLVVKVHYPDAKNFEGMKVMVYSGIYTVNDLLSRVLNKLDPHFSEVDISPDARFPPTDEGWGNALAFAKFLVAKRS